MRKSLNARVALAATAVLIVIAVLIATSINPSLLYGMPAPLWAIAEIIKAINGTPRDRRPRRRLLRGPAAEPELGAVGDEDDGSESEDDGPSLQRP
ncbi:hypothetical protein [Amycolatopsis sp. lyj-23]|uniref:hypothetical protein n=1 Tax=Amycolatopsis sp. lyj-23 TaxID=2789283 RepID=UPI00397DC437